MNSNNEFPSAVDLSTEADVDHNETGKDMREHICRLYAEYQDALEQKDQAKYIDNYSQMLQEQDNANRRLGLIRSEIKGIFGIVG